jgi:hypothetical protein
MNKKYLEGAWNKCAPYQDVPVWLRITEPMLQRPLVPDDRAKQVRAVSAANRKPVVGWDGNGRIEHYPSWVAAGVAVGKSPEALCNASREGSYTAGRYWMREIW